MERYITAFPEYQRYNSGAYSPPRGVYAKMTPEEMEYELGAEIPLNPPSWAERAKSMIGMKTVPRYDQRAVRIARLMTQSKHAHNEKLSEQFRQRALDAKNAEDAREYARLAAIDLQRDYDATRNSVSHAAEAAEERRAQLPHPITAQNVRDAERKYQDLRVNAYNSAITNAPVLYGQEYDIISAQRDAARQDSEALKSRQAAQQKKEHEQRMNDFIKEGELRKHRQFFGLPTGGRRGGKSKRVKSKRNKRSTKRRNARK